MSRRILGAVVVSLPGPVVVGFATAWLLEWGSVDRVEAGEPAR